MKNIGKTQLEMHLKIGNDTKCQSNLAKITNDELQRFLLDYSWFVQFQAKNTNVPEPAFDAPAKLRSELRSALICLVYGTHLTINAYL